MAVTLTQLSWHIYNYEIQYAATRQSIEVIG